MSLVLILAAAGLLLGGSAYLAGWIRYPLRNLLILLATTAGLVLWILYRWWRYS